MRKKASLMLGLVSCLLLTGCFDVEQSLVLQKDLSGKAGFSMKVDMESMVLTMLQMQRSMTGQEGAPTAAEIEKAKAEFLASKKTEVKMDPAKQKAELEKSLPKGVKLLDSSFTDEGLKMAANFLFGFDNVSKLKQIRFPKEKKEGEAEAAQAGPGSENPFDEPFADLQIVEQGSTLLVTSKATNPMQEQKEQMKESGMSLDPEMEKQIEQAFKGLRIAWKIEAPFEVIEHNATRKQGNTLYWEYTLDTMKKMTAEQAAQGIRVKYKKG